MSDLIPCDFTKRLQLTMVFTEMCMTKAGYFFGFFGDQILKAFTFLQILDSFMQKTPLII
jgi:hypothetical protein